MRRVARTHLAVVCLLAACNDPAIPPPDGRLADVVDAETDAIETDVHAQDNGPYSGLEIQPVAIWGRGRGLDGEGHGLDDFSNPSGIALSSDESEIYVYDVGNRRIKALSREGETLRTWPHPEPSCGSNSEPIAVALDGTILIVDSGAHELVRYSPSGEEVGRWRIAGAPAFCSSSPQHSHPLVVGPNGDLYLAEVLLGQIQQYTIDGNLVRTFGEPGEDKGQFALGPLGLAIANGVLYAPDVIVRFSPSKERFLLFDLFGSFLGYLPPVPDAPYFYFATAMMGVNGWLAAIRDDSPPMIFLKPPTSEVFVYRWSAASRNPGPGNLGSAFALAIASDGLWYITDHSNHCIRVMRPSVPLE